MSSDRLWWYVFAVAFIFTGLIETYLPIRSLPSSTLRRWTNNSILSAISNAAGRVAFQVSGIALAFSVRANAYGVLNRLSISHAARFVIGFAALDLTAYGTHRLFHFLAPLWRVHRVHHSETDLDITTGLRFHPIEVLLEQGLGLVTIALMGVPPDAAIFAGLAVIVQDLLHHANIRFPESINRLLRLVTVTPAMHRMHHSEQVPMQNTNFGSLLSFWDRLFGTYNAVPTAIAQQERYGVLEIANGSDLNAANLLLLPFRRQPDGKP